ncbi:hypothetical protein LB542_19670 [Mesorhizobium sp. BR1-1-9]|uniref:hypothetical protein n=1 Tax=Mesorhizobium sp. BR1-1-9 TaxID=2876646 RepID=UPI001CD0C07E|nr:hypothetical protein [Mesorhizobium sp. BR1-1-9]MBZ9873069.1 hypothetical protein [Mesorhizobium sp. BR1-1-9]
MTSIQIDRTDGLSSSTAIKGPVRVATTANITLSGEQTIDGIAVVTDDRVLVKDQTTGPDNGIYIASTGVWRRAKDFSSNRDVKSGTMVLVTGGTTNAALWQLTATNPIVIGTTSLAFGKALIQPTPGAVFDALAPTTTRGDLIFRNATTNTRLAAGTSGYLQTNGPSADPTWASFADVRDSLDTPVYVATRTAMKALTPTKDLVVILYEAGREGTFVVKAGSPPVTDTQEGVYIVSNTASFYWERVYAPAMYPSVYVFGALGGTNDDSVPVQAAIDVLGTAYLAYRSTGYTFGNITLAGGKQIIGERQVIVKSTALVGGYVVRVTTPSVTAGIYGRIKDITFDLTAADTASTAIRFGTSAGVVFGFRGTGLQFKNCGEAIGDETHASNYVVDVYFQDCLCFLSRGRQVYSKRSRGFFTFRDFKVDHTYNTGQVTWEGARFEDLIGLELEKFDVVGPTIPTSTYQSTATGLIIVGQLGSSASVWLRRVLVDNTRGPGISLSNLHNVFSVDTCVFQNLGPAMSLASVSKSLFTNTKIVGGTGLTGAAASAVGLQMTSCTSVVFTNLEVESNTGNGVVQTSCIDCSIIGGYSNSNGGSGYVEVTAATRNLRSGVRALSNGTSSLIQIGAQSATVDWWANGGSFLSSNAGVITV